MLSAIKASYSHKYESPMAAFVDYRGNEGFDSDEGWYGEDGDGYVERWGKRVLIAYGSGYVTLTRYGSIDEAREAFDAVTGGEARQDG